MRGKLIPLALGIGALTGPACSAPAAPSGDKAEAARHAGDPAHAALLAQARFWQARNRDDLAIEALHKLLASAPDHPDGLALLAFVQRRANRKEQARQTRDRLRRINPDHPDLARLDTLDRIEGRDSERLRRARMLARSGRSEEALAALRELYPAGPPTADLALEYWQTVGDTKNGWEAALDGLEELVAAQPDHPRYRLALAEHVAARRPDDAAALKTIAELARLPQLGKQARAAWRRAMLRLDGKPAHIALIEEYLAQEEGDDSAVQAHLAEARQTVGRQQRLLADPHYRARRAGLAALDAGRLDEADAQLQYAAEGRPDDAEVLGALGLIRLRQGRHAQAQDYLRQARTRDRANGRWDSLLRTARFWGLMREASAALDAGEHGVADAKLGEARALDRREPAAALAQARVRIAQGRLAEAEARLREALALDPAQAGAARELALLYLRTGREAAIDALRAAMTADARREVADALATARAARLREQADAALAAGNAAHATALLEQAAALARDDAWLRHDLARLYAGRGESARADALFADLLARRPGDADARHAHALVLAAQERPDAALAELERIAAGERSAGMASLQRRLWSGLVARQARAAAQGGNAGAARRLLDDAQRQAGADSELALEFADARIDIGDTRRAQETLRALIHAEPPSVAWSLRHARLLAAAGGADALPALIDRIAAQPLDDAQKNAVEELRIGLALRRADALRADRRLDAALHALAPSRRAHPQHEGLLAAEARLLRALGQRVPAQDNYRRLLALRPDNRDAALALAELLVESREPEAARRLLDAQLAGFDAATPGQQADLIAILLDLNDPRDDARARQLLDSALARAADDPRLLDHAGRLAHRAGRIDAAIGFLQRSLAAQNPAPPLSVLRTAQSPDGTRPHALDVLPPPAGAQRTEEPYKLRRLAEWTDQGTTWLSAAVDRRSRSGTAGTSEYALTEMPLEWKQPLSATGRWTVRADLVSVRAGRLDLAASGDVFGSSLLGGPASGLLNQRADGIALHALLERGRTRYDIGTTPLGFPVQTVTGGILHKGALGPFGYSVDASRRPLTGSLLSYAGARDPRTGQVWGGVQATGVRFGLSLDDGGRFGGWSSLGLHRLAGRNVQGNNRMQLMAGGILRVINEDDRLLQFGITGMHWRMSENAGEYTFGHGGYYSPARYSSLSLPVTFGARHARLSYALRASVSVSRARTDAADFFPTDAAMQAAAGADARYGGGPGRGTGRSLSLSWEYQADARLFIGGRAELERSPDYAPNRFVVYLRYALDRQAARPVSFLPEPVNPVSQF